MLTDLRDMLTAPTLTLPIGGQAFVVQECPAETWLRLQEVNDRATAKVTEDGDTSATLEDVGGGMSETEMVKLALGDTYQQMIAGGVRPSELRHAGITAYYWQLGNESVAAAMWESAGKAPAPTKTAPTSSTPKRTRREKSSMASPTTTTSRPRKSTAKTA